MKKKKRIAIPLGIIGFLCLILLIAYIPVSKNIRFRMLMAVSHMSGETLSSSAYILNDIDIQKLCRDYMNGDVAVNGTVGLSKVRDYRFSINIDIDGKRSFEQKKMYSASLIKALRYEVGNVDVYAKEDTLYFDAPILGDMSFSFPIGQDLFARAPDLTSDIDKEWFKENRRNIYDFMQEIRIEETGNTLKDEDGTVSEEYKVTIPEGSGAFLWELMGMDAPSKDIVYNIFLTKNNRVRRVTMDLSDTIDEGFFVMDGTDMGDVNFSCKLPDNEFVNIHAVRNPETKHRIDFDIQYKTKDDKNYEVTTAIEWMKFEDKEGFEMKARRIKIFCGDEQLASGSFSGNVLPEDNMGDVFDGKEDYVLGFKEKSWEQIRDDTEQFIMDVLDKLSLW